LANQLNKILHEVEETLHDRYGHDEHLGRIRAYLQSLEQTFLDDAVASNRARDALEQLKR
jgi:hypothetical protein